MSKRILPNTFEGSSSGTKRQKKVIDIILHGGVVSDIVDIPDNVTIRVWDYDVQGENEDALFDSPYDKRKAKLEYWE